MIEVVVFDMDGLLVDSEPYWDQSQRALASRYGKVWTEQDHQAVMGANSDEWSQYMITTLELPMTREEVKDDIVRTLASLYREKTRFLPGAVDAVKLCSHYWPLVLASGSHPTLIELVTHCEELAGRFQVVLSADEVGVGKPAPDIYLQVCRRLGVEPRNAACLEDSANGVLSAHRAGTYVIAVPDERFPLAEEIIPKAALVLKSLCDVTPRLVESLKAIP